MHPVSTPLLCLAIRALPRREARQSPLSPPKPVTGTTSSSEIEADAELIARIARGDAAAFRELSDRYLPKILTYAARLSRNPTEAEDIAQETFLRAWQHAPDYKPKGRASTWLFAIAHNLAIDRMRRRRRRPEDFEVDDERDAAPYSRGPGQLLERKEKVLTVQQALDQLPERQREALVLSHEQGLSNPEIAQVLDTSVEAIESLLARARRGLRVLLSAHISRIPS